MFCFGSASDVGKVWPAEHETWTDPEFGYEITRWTSHDSLSWHVYFNIESFIDENHAIIFSRRNGYTNLFRLDLETGEMLQMTDEKNLDDHIWHWPALGKLWYVTGKQIVELETNTLRTRIAATLEFSPGSFTVTCDGKWIVCAAELGQPDKPDDDDYSRGPYAIFRISTTSGEIMQITPAYGFVISHLQASPTDPSRISYCWQHLYREGIYPGTRGQTPIRIWWVDIGGENGGPVGPQEFGLHRTHEFWFPDGKRIGYSARYKFGKNKGKQFLGSCLPDGSDNYMFEAPVSAAHSQMFKDLRHWVVDIYDGSVLTLLTIDNRKVAERKSLFRHDSSWQGQPSHPHPHFSPDGTFVLFSTDKTGSPQVYTVRIDLNFANQYETSDKKD